jgi:uncharacterized protein YjdB
LIAATALNWGNACGDTTGVTEVPQTEVLADSTPTVSDPISANASTLSLASFAAQVGGTGSEIAYVSLRPGTFPAGERVTIQRRGSPSTVTGPMEEGGLNPVPIVAAEGDTVDVEVQMAGGSVARFAVRVPITRRPKIVRTYPPPKKRDVALNARIVVVFTEPVAPATLTTSSVRLLRNGAAVAGTVRVLEGSTASAVFESSTPLSANTEYELVVTEAVRDLAGDPLETSPAITFTTGGTLEGPVASVRVAPDSAEVVVGSQLQLAAIASDLNGNALAGRNVHWTSSDTAVATVSPAGLVTAVAEGTTFITAEIDGQGGGIDLRVSATVMPVAAVILTPQSARVGVGNTITLVADTRDSAGRIVATPRVLSWTSSDPAVATVSVSSSRSALVRGVAEGAVQIRVTVDGVADTSTVTIGPPLPSVGLVLSPDSATVVLRGVLQLLSRSLDSTGGLTPVDSTQVAWTSSDPSIASVGATGIVTGLRAGSATIAGSWSGHRGTASITVVPLSFSQLRANGSHTCGLTPSGKAYCWGYGWDGQVGGGTQGFILAPMGVAGGLTFSTVDVSWNASCSLTTDGALYCWGLNETGEARCGNGGCSLTPVAAAGGLRFVAMARGGVHTCGLMAGGAAYCWEFLDWSKSPVAVTGGLTFTSITAGGSHVCALTAEGVAYCWGSNHAGQLGAASPNDCDGLCSPSPIAVAGGLRFTALSAGEEHTCGLTTSGSVYCWGVPAAYGSGGSTTPSPVMQGVALVAITGKAGYSCGLTSSGAIRCWDDWGATAARQPWTVPGSVAFTTITAGEGYGCAITATQVGYCWGRNDMGQLGIGTSSDYVSVPVKVGGQP